MVQITLESQQGSIEIEFQLTWEEKRAASLLLLSAFRRKIGLDKLWRGLFAICGVLVMAAVLVLWLAGATAAGIVAATLIGSATVVLVAGYFVLKRLEHQRIGPLRTASPVRQNWRLSSRDITVRFGNSTLQMPWSEIRTAHHVEGMSLIFLDETLYLIIPDRAFVSSSHRLRFQAYLKAAMDPSHQTRTAAKAA